MDSDDDFELFAPVEVTSPPIHERKLKRLKKAVDLPAESLLDPPDLGLPPSGEPEGRSSDDERFLPEQDADSGFNDKSAFDDEDSRLEGGEEEREVSGVGVKRALEFDSSDEMEGEGPRDYNAEERNEGAVGVEDSVGRISVGEFNEEDKEENKKKRKTKKSKKKRSEELGVQSDDGGPEKGEATVVAKRVSEKERRYQLNQLRADSQRLLRESREAAFKPVPPVRKPIASVLEKIRQRKLELEKKTVPVKKSLFNYSLPNFMRDDLELMIDSTEIEIKAESRAAKVVNENTVASPKDSETVLDTSHDDRSNDASNQPNHVDVPPQMEGIKQTYRAPIDDTQELFSDSESNHAKDELLTELPRRPTEEVFAPSLLAMNLKLDSAPQDETSDEEDNDKENIDPHSHQFGDLSIPPKGDPVKNFIDEEAEEEDDSDNDMIRFQENEEDYSEDDEELNNMIASDYREENVDREKRNELHQKWLEQQDAVGTENLLLKLNCGLKQANTSLVDMMDDKENEAKNEQENEELSDNSEDDLATGNVARMNLRKIKQMIPQMFTDEADAYVSSEDEDFEKRLTKQSLLLKTEVQGKLVSPAEDESSREVFRLIKKLNIAPDNKKRAKSSVRDDTLLGGKPNDLLKPSFLGRGSTSLQSSKNHKTRKIKAFVFGRDDSNSKSIASTSEDLDIVNVERNMEREVQHARTSSAKVRSSQSKCSSQTTKATVAVSSTTSTTLYDILRHFSKRSDQFAQSTVIDQSTSMFTAFRVGNKSRDGRVQM